WTLSTDGGATFTNINGATSTTLTLTGVTQAMSGNQYQAVFTNAAGTATSAAAVLTVNTALIITTQPTSQTITTGHPATFPAAARASPTPTVPWTLSTDGGATFSNLSGATSPTLTVATVTQSMSGNQYKAVFTNASGSATTNAATLLVQGPLVYTAP